MKSLVSLDCLQKDLVEECVAFIVSIIVRLSAAPNDMSEMTVVWYGLLVLKLLIVKRAFYAGCTL